MTLVAPLKGFVILITGFILFAPISHALDKPIERKGLTPAGEVVFVSGKAQVRLVPEDNYRPAAPRQELVPGDIVKTASGGRLSILFKDETQLKLASNTTLMIKEVTSQAERPGVLKILLKLESGEVWTRSKGISDGLMIETPNATAAIRGTEWGLSVMDNQSRVVVMEGNVQLSSPVASINVGRNEQAIVTGRDAPVKSLVIMPRDRTQWTHYLTEKRLIGYLKFREGILERPQTLFNEGRLEESAEAFERILSADPENASALTGLGLIELKRGEVEKAGAYLDQSLKAKKGPLALSGKSYLFISSNRTEEAGKTLRDAEESFPNSPLPYLFSSYLFTFLGDFPGALRECDRGLSTIPNDPLLLGFKADIYFILDKPREAKETIDLLIGKNPESPGGYERLGFYERMVNGDAKRAKQALQRSIDLDGLNDEAMAKLADLLREEGYIPQALKLIEHALTIAPWNAMHHYNYGRLLADINRIDAAREEFEKALELDSTFSRAYLGEGIVLLREGRTKEALKELSKASLFEPNLSEIHSFLAIAYYQRQEVGAALDELRRAEECDSLDSTPHQLASVIYNDLYMPAEAIEEARKVLDLLPYRKASGEALLESSQNGTMAVNYGLDFLDLPEWSLYYAQKALFIDPYRNTSHIGVAKAYRKLGQVSALQGFNEFTNPFLSEQLQGLTLNVNSLNFSNRYSTLISKPGHYLTAGGTYGWGDSTEAQGDVTATGDFGSRFPLTYWFYSKAYRDSGHLSNNPYKEADGNLILGYKPSYDHDIYLDVAYSGQKVGVPPSASVPAILRRDDDETLKENLYWVQLGYHKRFSPVSHLIAELRYFNSKDKIENPDFETDHTGFTFRRNKFQNAAWGIRHMLNLFEDHQASYGMDYNHLKLNMIDRWGTQEARDSLGRESFVLYIYDRWAIGPGMTLDAGLFLSYYDAEADLVYRGTKQSIVRPYHKEIFNRDILNLNPRLGFAVDLGKSGVLRVAYQRRSTPGFAGELAPVGASGLIPPTFDIEFNAANDFQGSVEYELTKKTFLKTLWGYERLTDLTTLGGGEGSQLHWLLLKATHFFYLPSSGSDRTAQLWYGRVAINQILGRHFSFSARYHYNNSRFLDGSGRKLPGVPLQSGDARIVFVHPSQLSLSLIESYVGKRFADSKNYVELKGYFSTDFLIQKEMLDKRVSLSFAVNNIFDQKHETIPQFYWWYQSSLPAKGRTFTIRGEYRF